MMPNRSCSLRVVVFRDPETSLWVSHCLDIDLVSQGTNPAEAVDSITDAISIVFNDDLENNLDPLDRNRAPDEEWEAFLQAMGHGVQVQDLSGSVVESDTVIACIIKMIRPYMPALDDPSYDPPVLEAWKVRGRDRFQSSHSAHC